MRYLVFFSTLFFFCNYSSKSQCPPPGSYGTLIVNPSKSVYCPNDNINFRFNKTNPSPYSIAPNWSFGGTANSTNASGPNNIDFAITGLLSGGVVSVTGALLIGGVSCPFSLNRNIAFTTLSADAGPDVTYEPCNGPVMVGLIPCEINGNPPYNPTASWSPPTGIVGSSTGCQIQVDNLLTDQEYTLTVNDQYCSATNQVKVNIACPPINNVASIIVSPNQTQYCLNSNISGNITINPCFIHINPVSWNFTGSPAITNSGVNDVNFSITNISASGLLTASGSVSLNGGNLICPYSTSFNLTLSDLSTTAGSDKIYVTDGGAITIGTTGCQINGVPPYSIAPFWTPVTGIVGSTSGCQVQVDNLATTTTYTITTSDQYCTATSQMTVLVSTMYCELKRELDSGFFTIKNNNLYFTIDGEYNTINLDYKIYNFQRTVMPGLTINPVSLNHGDNRYHINVSNLQTGYYVLETINQKNEKRLLRFFKP